MAHDTKHVADRLLDEGLHRVATVFAGIGVRVSSFTLIRWIVAGADGVCLEAIKIGGTWHTSEAAGRRFLRERADAQRRHRGPDRKNLRAVAEAKLKARGIGGAKA